MCLTTRSDVSDTVPETGLGNPDQRSVSPVVQERALHLIDMSSNLPRDRLTLGMIPVQNELLAPVLLDQVTVYGDRAIGEG